MSRAQRRHHTQRIKDRVKRGEIRLMQNTDKGAGLYANHGAACSCPACGNPRRHFGELTLQERRTIGSGSGE